jgi:hypothetical protein
VKEYGTHTVPLPSPVLSRQDTHTAGSYHPSCMRTRVQAPGGRRREGRDVRWVPDSVWKICAASKYPSVTRKFITSLFMSSLRTLTAASLRSHSSTLVVFLPIAW